MAKKIAIVTSFREDCGIAYHSVRIIDLFKKVLGIDLDIIRLPVSDLRGRSSWQRRASTLFIDETAKKLAAYDHVILQLEPGLYGSSPSLIYPRLIKLVQSIRHGMIIAHSYGNDDNFENWGEAALALLRLKPWPLFDKIAAPIRRRSIRAFWRKMKARNLGVLTLNRRDYHIIGGQFNITNIDHFPLCYFTDEEIAGMKREVDRQTFCRRYNLPEDKRLVAITGFFGKYKGHLTAFKALEYLPDDYHIVVVGGEHPQGLPIDRSMSPYMQKLVSFSTMVFDEKAGIGDRALTKGTPNGWADIFEDDEFYHFLPRKSLADRIHFIGSVSDTEMPQVYAAIDCAVHPYLNTRAMQSGSGPATFAVEMGPPSLYTNAPVFREMKYYFPFMETFNVGNYRELASKILTADAWAPTEAARTKARGLYNPATMCAVYCRLVGMDIGR